MCGGVIFPYRVEFSADLAQIYSEEEAEAIAKTGYVRSLYWQRADPVLPATYEDGSGAHIFRWGNRNKGVTLPETGWARLESIEQGKWAHLRPLPVIIPVTYGVEKGKWFEIEQGIKGLLVERGGQQRVYMLTVEADPNFRSVTGHERMPVLIEQTDFPWLPAEPGGTLHAPESKTGS